MQSRDKVADDNEEEGKNQAFLTLFCVQQKDWRTSLGIHEPKRIRYFYVCSARLQIGTCLSLLCQVILRHVGSDSTVGSCGDDLAQRFGAQVSDCVDTGDRGRGGFICDHIAARVQG